MTISVVSAGVRRVRVAPQLVVLSVRSRSRRWGRQCSAVGVVWVVAMMSSPSSPFAPMQVPTSVRTVAQVSVLPASAPGLGQALAVGTPPGGGGKPSPIGKSKPSGGGNSGGGAKTPKASTPKASTPKASTPNGKTPPPVNSKAVVPNGKTPPPVNSKAVVPNGKTPPPVNSNAAQVAKANAGRVKKDAPIDDFLKAAGPAVSWTQDAYEGKEPGYSAFKQFSDKVDDIDKAAKAKRADANASPNDPELQSQAQALERQASLGRGYSKVANLPKTIMGGPNNAIIGVGGATSDVGKTVTSVGQVATQTGTKINNAGKKITGTGDGLVARGQNLSQGGKLGKALGKPVAGAGNTLQNVGNSIDGKGNPLLARGQTIISKGQAIDNAGQQISGVANKLKDVGSGLGKVLTASPANNKSVLKGAESAAAKIPGVSKLSVLTKGALTPEEATKAFAKNSLKGFSVISTAINTAQAIQDVRHGGSVQRAALENGGSLVGGAVGGAVGSLIPIPVVGTFVGSAVGSWVGGKAGSWLADLSHQAKPAG